MSKTVSQKMGIKEGSRAFFWNVPESAQDALILPSIKVSAELVEEFDYIHFFTTTQSYNNSYGKLPSATSRRSR